MTSATQLGGQSEVGSRKSAEKPTPGTSRRAVKRPRLKGLFGLWRDFSRTLEWECSEDEARHRWASETLQHEVASWSNLTPGEVRFLRGKLRAALGISPLNDYIARAAVRLFGSDWNAMLAERIGQRFHRGPEIQTLEFWQKKALFEELVGRIARRDLAGESEVGSRKSAESPDPAALAARTESVRMGIVRERTA